MIKTTDTSGKILFEEQQHFPQWLMFLMIVPLLVSIAAFATTGILRSGEKYLWLVFVFVILLQLAIIYYFKVAIFEKVVTETGLYFRWIHLHKRYRFIPRTDIEGFRIRRGP